MNSTVTRPARRIATTLVAAGIAALGSVALAPAASAAPALEGPAVVLDAPGNDNGNGPDAFILIDNRHVPVFFCDTDSDKGEKHAKDDKVKKIKHENKCTPTGEGESGRF